MWPVDDVWTHPSADVAALYLESGSEKLEFFRRPEPHPEYGDSPLGTEVSSIGFPVLPDETPVNIRLMAGQIQSRYVFEKAPYVYDAFELSFAVFGGHSGSPLVLEHARKNVIGVTTNCKILTHIVNEKEIASMYAVAASLSPLEDWLDNL